MSQFYNHWQPKRDVFVIFCDELVTLQSRRLYVIAEYIVVLLVSSILYTTAQHSISSYLCQELVSGH